MNDRVALYVRVSTDEQELAGQERELRAYAESRGWPVARVYAERVTATGKVEREAWMQLAVDAAAQGSRDFDRVLVWSLDRWSREPSFVQAVGSIELLESHGVRFHSLKEPQLDSGDDDAPNLGRDLLRGILPTIAAFEARRRAERTQLAMDEIRSGRRPTRSGLPVGRPRRLTPEIAREALELRAKELTWSEIALRLHLPAGTLRGASRALLREKPRV